MRLTRHGIAYRRGRSPRAGERPALRDHRLAASLLAALFLALMVLAWALNH